MEHYGKDLKPGMTNIQFPRSKLVVAVDPRCKWFWKIAEFCGAVKSQRGPHCWCVPFQCEKTVPSTATCVFLDNTFESGGCVQHNIENKNEVLALAPGARVVMLSQNANEVSCGVEQKHLNAAFYEGLHPLVPRAIRDERPLCLFGTLRVHKVYFGAVLLEIGVLDSIKWASFPTPGFDRDSSSPESYCRILDSIGLNDARVLQCVPKFLELADSNYTEESVDAKLNHMCSPMLELHSKCFFEIVVESETYSSPETGKYRTRITEKTTRCLALGVPFLLFGCVGSLAYLHDLGFKTFAFDESYDSIFSSKARAEAVGKEAQRLLALGADDRNALCALCVAATEHNALHIRSEAFRGVVEGNVLDAFRGRPADFPRLRELMSQPCERLILNPLPIFPSSTSSNRD